MTFDLHPRLSNLNPTKMNKPKQTQRKKAHNPTHSFNLSLTQQVNSAIHDTRTGKMQSLYAKRHRSPETTTESNKKPKVWNPKDQAQAPVRKSTFPARSLKKDLADSKFDIDSQLDEDRKKVDEAIRTAKTPEQCCRVFKSG